MSKSPSGWLWTLVRLALALAALFLALLIYLDAAVRKEFEGTRWDLPGEVYARPLELFQGQTLTLADLRAELEALEYVFDGDLTRQGHVMAVRNGFMFHTRGFPFWDGEEQARVLRVRVEGGVVVALTDQGLNGVALARLEPLLFERIHPTRPEDRVLVDVADVPELLKNALLVVEDRDFYSHSGFKLSAMLRAAIANVKAGQMAQGGSTITQQLVKNMYLDPRKSIGRKVIELFMAALLEVHYEKAEILEAYLNEVYLAQDGNRAIHGFGLASDYFFARPLGDLELHEMALLVAIVKGPSYYSPIRNPERAQSRRDLVIRMLLDHGLIEPSDAAFAIEKPLDLRARSSREYNFPAYVDLVKRELVDVYDRNDLTTRGLKIFTSLDPLIQIRSRKALEGVISSLAPTNPRLADLEGAVIVTSVSGGEVVAVVGGRRVIRSGFNRALDAVRPVGSLAKPAVFLSALSGDAYTLASRVSDAPVSVDPGGGQPLWHPENYDRESHGNVMLLDALVNSYNQATVRLGQDVGVPSVVETIEKLGVERKQPAVPSLFLGAGEMSPLDVSRMYLTLASGGYRKPLRTIRAVVSSSGKLQTRFAFNVEQAFDASSVYLVNFALREVMHRGTASQVMQYGEVSDLAGKTGTTDDYRDSWFAGYSNQWLAVVWLGNDDNSPTGLTGSSGALRVWSRLTDIIADGSGTPTQPSTIVKAYIDPDTGERVSGSCQGALQIPFRRGTEPSLRHKCEGEKGGVMSKLRDLLQGEEG